MERTEDDEGFDPGGDDSRGRRWRRSWPGWRRSGWMPSSCTRGRSCCRRPRSRRRSPPRPFRSRRSRAFPVCSAPIPPSGRRPSRRSASGSSWRGRSARSGCWSCPQFGRVPALPDLSPLATGAELERNLLLAQLRELAPAAQAAGVSLFLEPLNRYEAYIVNRLEQGAAIAAEVGPEIGVMADFFHMGIEEADIAASIRANGSTSSTSTSPTATACSPAAATSISVPASAPSKRSATTARSPSSAASTAPTTRRSARRSR